MLMLDLCCGWKGASAAMRERGWKVITLDIDPRYQPDILADVRGWTWSGERPDLIWSSPPCLEFSRWDLYHLRKLPNTPRPPWPDLSIVQACQRITLEAAPRYWILENVRGAVPFLGQPSVKLRPFYLWGSFPPLGRVRFRHKKDNVARQDRAAKRAIIPYAVSQAVALAVEINQEFGL